MMTDPRPINPAHMTPDQFRRLNLMESGWLSFRDQSASVSYDDPDRRCADCFYAGASFIIAALTVLAEEQHELCRFEVCDKLDAEVEAFREASGYTVTFRPYLR